MNMSAPTHWLSTSNVPLSEYILFRLLWVLLPLSSQYHHKLHIVFISWIPHCLDSITPEKSMGPLHLITYLNDIKYMQQMSNAKPPGQVQLCDSQVIPATSGWHWIANAIVRSILDDRCQWQFQTLSQLPLLVWASLEASKGQIRWPSQWQSGRASQDAQTKGQWIALVVEGYVKADARTLHES